MASSDKNNHHAKNTPDRVIILLAMGARTQAFACAPEFPRKMSINLSVAALLSSLCIGTRVSLNNAPRHNHHAGSAPFFTH